MRLLELFSGTHSVGKVARARGYVVVSLDMNLPADIKANILDWDYKIYQPGYFDVITASPVCLWWSALRTTHFGKQLKAHPEGVFTRQMYENDINIFGKPMVDRVLEIIEYFNPRYYWIENPQTGLMKDYINLSFYDVDYCRYAQWGYRKRTRFWTNIKTFSPKLCEKKCGQMIGNRHVKQLGSCKKGERVLGKGTTKYERYRIPPKLIEDLLDHCYRELPVDLLDAIKNLNL